MKKLIIILLAGLFMTSSGTGQDIPDPMQPPRMVNDFSGLLEAGNREQLEKKLQDFYYETSTQIYIVILDDIAGYDIADFTFQLGDKWGVGTKDKD
ncbi:MAG: TPM domain-containing protein, partial [Bacteroidales bacterium]